MAADTFAHVFDFMADLMIYYKDVTAKLQTFVDDPAPVAFKFKGECPHDPCIPPGPCFFPLQGDTDPNSFEDHIDNLENSFANVISDARTLINRAAAKNVDNFSAVISRNPCPRGPVGPIPPLDEGHGG